MIDKSARIKELENIILNARNAYYNGEDALMSDAEFDTYENELTQIDPDNPLLHKVGEDSGSVFTKAVHIIPMGSQQKATDPEMFRSWAKENLRDEYIVQYKCDGSSIELQYFRGKFIRAITRGNGKIGDDVTDNISKAKGVVFNLPDTTFTGGVRGEVLLFHDDFKEHCKDKANCRNAANGIMKRKYSDNANLLTIVTYDVLRSEGETQFKDEYEKFNYLTSQGFNVVDTFYMSDIDEIIKLRDELSTSRFESIPYDIDGIVIKCPEVDFKDVQNDRPNKQIAFKFILNEQPTICRQIEWSVTGSTRTPVAICDPVFLCGTTVKRANLCNLNLITNLGLKIGSTVIMVKRGEIIPKIERVVLTPPDAKPVEFPKVCEFCGSPLVIESTRVYCPNPQCSETQKHRIVRWCDVNNIFGLGSATVEELYDAGIVTKIEDLYTVSKEDMSKIISPKIVEKIFTHIDKSREMSVLKFIGGYDLDGIGETIADSLLRGLANIKNLNDLFNADVNTIASIQGFAQTSATNIYNELQSVKSELLSLSNKIKVTFPEYSNGVSHAFGQTFVFTGPLKTMTRDEAIEKVRASGGKVATSVSKNVNFLVTNDTSSGSTKNKAATELGIDVIDEDNFVRLINGTW